MSKEKTLNKGRLEHSAEVAARHFALSRNPDRAMLEMMETINALRAVYIEENEALEASDPVRFLELQDKKIGIARDYQTGAAQMLERREEMKKADPQLRSKLLHLHDDFSGLTAKNLDALERVRKGVQRLGERIMSAARDAARNETLNYGASGNLKKNERAVSIGLNESA